MLKIVTESKCLIISNILDVKLTFMFITPVYDAKCILIIFQMTAIEFFFVKIDV